MRFHIDQFLGSNDSKELDPVDCFEMLHLVSCRRTRDDLGKSWSLGFREIRLDTTPSSKRRTWGMRIAEEGCGEQ